MLLKNGSGAFLAIPMRGVADVKNEHGGDFKNARQFQHTCPLLTCSSGFSLVASGLGVFKAPHAWWCDTRSQGCAVGHDDPTRCAVNGSLSWRASLVTAGCEAQETM